MLECPANYVRTPHRATHHPGGTPSPLGWPPGCASCLPAMRTPVLNPFAMAEHGSAPAVLCEAGTGEGRNAVGATSAGHEMAGRRTSLCQGMPAWNLASKRTSAGCDSIDGHGQLRSICQWRRVTSEPGGVKARDYMRSTVAAITTRYWGRVDFPRVLSGAHTA